MNRLVMIIILYIDIISQNLNASIDYDRSTNKDNTKKKKLHYEKYFDVKTTILVMIFIGRMCSDVKERKIIFYYKIQ